MQNVYNKISGQYLSNSREISLSILDETGKKALRNRRMPADNFATSNSGSLTPIFALVFTAALGAIGIGVDYARAISLRTQLQNATDAAALAVANDPSISDSQAIAIATTTFLGNADSKPLKIAPSVAVSRMTGANASATVASKATAPTLFAKIFGFKDITIDATATAAAGLKYTAVYAAIDLSASPSLGADATARAKLQALTKPYLTGTSLTRTPNGCEFACHSREGWEPSGTTTYQMAATAGIPPRLDIMSVAFNSFVDGFFDPKDVGVIAGRKQMAAIGFSADAQLLAGLTTDTAALKAASQKFPDASRDVAILNTSLATIKSLVGVQGDGSSSETPVKTLLIITDGIREKIRGDVSVVSAFDNTLCDVFKDTGINIAIINIKDIFDPRFYYHDLKITSTCPTYSSALKNCASSGLHFTAADSDAALLGSTFTSAGNIFKARSSLTK